MANVPGLQGRLKDVELVLGSLEQRFCALLIFQRSMKSLLLPLRSQGMLLRECLQTERADVALSEDETCPGEALLSQAQGNVAEGE